MIKKGGGSRHGGCAHLGLKSILVWLFITNSMRAAVGSISWGAEEGLVPFSHPYTTFEVQSAAPEGIQGAEGR